MRPAFTSSRNCEYSIGACAAWRVLNWLNTVISTSPITSQMTRFLSMLFKDLLLFSEAAAEGPSYADFSPPYMSPWTLHGRLRACARSLCRSHVSIVGELRRTLSPGRPSARTHHRFSMLFYRSSRLHMRYMLYAHYIC